MRAAYFVAGAVCGFMVCIVVLLIYFWAAKHQEENEHTNK